MSSLYAICKESKTAVNSSVKELKDKEYVVVTKVNPSEQTRGKYQHTIMQIFDEDNIALKTSHLEYYKEKHKHI